ncbi:unnamed protein product [Kuraishia capsulata CBS 1993]|uniref:Uncharacterized protein n=1 Tax=Kuraishia capsulata CBS 1993 TaxID=1382522 RepID=W6MTB9_9ASCO|nr:uncharacterized protein KUCA_T00004424001 [Kuraishia capsulata CBS 1993]CDK28442.1 unnamed protein product [Kuraishia capsulata CBS 1993]
MASYLNDFEDAQKSVYMLEPARKKLKKGVPNHVETLKAYHSEELFDPENTSVFPRLLGGAESQDICDKRYKKFRSSWAYQQQKIDAVLLQESEGFYDQLRKFLVHGFSNHDFEIKKLKTALLYMGSNISNHSRTIDDFCDFLKTKENKVVISRISSRNCPSLIFAIGQIIGCSEAAAELQSMSDNEAFEEPQQDLITSKKLDLSNMFVSLQRTKSCLTVIIQDADSLPPNILEPLLDLLNHSAPLVRVSVLLGISTPLSVFQDKLSRETIRQLHAVPFQTNNSKKIIDRVLETVLFNTDRVSYNDLIIGPRVLDLLWKQRDANVLSVTAFISLLKFIFMIHYYDQPLSVFWSLDDTEEITPEHLKVLRSLSSVTDFIFHAARDPETPKEEAKQLFMDVMTNDEMLVELTRDTKDNLFTWITGFAEYVDLVYLVHQYFATGSKKRMSKIEIAANVYRAPEGLVKSEHYKETLDALAGVSYSEMLTFIETLGKSRVAVALKGIIRDQLDLAAKEFANKPELKNVSLASKSLPPKYQERLEAISIGLVKLLFRYENNCLIPLQNDEMVGKEMCTIDIPSGNPNKSLLLSAFFPAARSTILNALHDPRLYLENIHYIKPPTCEDANSAGNQLSKAVRPILTELFHLYREANTVINIYDFYQAFQANFPRENVVDALVSMLDSADSSSVLEDLATRKNLLLLLKTIQSDNGKESELAWDKLSLALFYQGVAEMQMLGLVRDARGGKTEILDKLIWKDL